MIFKRNITAKLRWSTRILSLLLFIYLVWITRYPLDTKIPVNLFFRISPLASIVSMLSTRKIIFVMLTGLVFLIISIFRGRFICRWICPLGTTMELTRRLARRNKWKLRIKPPPRINYILLGLLIGMAVLSIPLAGIFEPFSIFLYALTGQRNIVALSFFIVLLLASIIIPDLWCSRLCPLGAMQSLVKIRKAKRGDKKVDISRRQFLASIFGGLFVALLINFKKKRLNPRLLRPPGALEEEEFTAQCIRCGECMKVCISKTLHPCILEAGIDGLWTPRLIPRIAPCELCMLCGRVCPTKAIEPLSLSQIHSISIGKSVIDRSRCIAWSEGKLCLICMEYCPVHAIYADEKNMPHELRDICIGCGKCEHNCPVEGEAAIIVTRNV